MADRKGFDPFAGGALSHTAPLTPEQQEIWLSIQLGGEPASLAYNEALRIELVGELDCPALGRAVQALVRRHEALRSTLSGDGTTLCVAVDGNVPLLDADLSRLEPDVQRTALEQALRALVTEPFDLVRGPLARATLVRLDERRHVLGFVAHHIVCDGWSAGVLLRDLGRLYAAEREGRDADLRPATAFSDYALARRREAKSDAARASLAYWLERFRHLPPPLELPLEAPRPAERRFEADRLDIELDANLVQRIKATAARHGASLTGLLLAGFQALLHRLSGQESMVVGVPAAGQSFTGDTTLVGHCVRTLPILANVDPRAPFMEHLRATRTALLDAYDHAEFTFGTLLEQLALPRDPSRIPLVAVLFNVDQDVPDSQFGDLVVRVESVPRAYENFELFVNGTFRGGALVLETTFSTALFTRDAVARRMAEYRQLLEEVATDPSRPIADLAVMPPAEKADVKARERGEPLEVPRQTLCGLFRDWARRDPERPAVTSGSRTWSYGDLDAATGALAADLCAQGVGPGSTVGVSLTRSADLVVALLGILRSGAAYVPLDPDYPREHLEYVTRDAELALIVTETLLLERLPAGTARVTVDAPRPPANLDRSEPESAAYVLYTSGSTGRPKGVVVEHRNLSHFIVAMAREPGLGAADTFVALTTPAFDISILELCVPLALGARVVIGSADEAADGRRLEALLSSSRATFLQATPAGYRALIESGWESSPPNLTLLCGGEALSPELAADLGRRCTRLWNCYGPTETTIWSTIQQIQGAPVTIGRPVCNTTTYVLDERLVAVAPGVVGELYIGGAGVARGYLRRPELTAERFVTDPFAVEHNARMYKTGDRVRRRWDGRLEWLGRNDSQVKVRGHRIELGEIEARLGELPAVREAVAVVREDRRGDQRIVAYVRPARDTEFDEHELGEALRRQIPAYMLPQHYVKLTTFPLTPNGKVDRRALPAPQAASASQYRTPLTEVQQQLAAEVFALLGARMGLDDDFFALGGHSLLALALGTRVRKAWGIEMPLRVVFAHPTLEAMADFVQAALDVRDTPATTRSTDASDDEEFTL